MASVSKRRWQAKTGEVKEAWRVTWYDRQGKRHKKQLATKRAADAQLLRIQAQLAAGISGLGAEKKIGDVAEAFLVDFQGLVAGGKRERSTLRMYTQHVELHLKPFGIAKVRAAELAGPDCLAYAGDLEASRNDAMAQRVFRTFRQILDFGVARAWLASNPSKAIRIRTAGPRADSAADHGDEVSIPPKAELRALLKAAECFDKTGRALALVWLLISAGLRASEIRGLATFAVDVKHRQVRVLQRADRWQRLGPVKSENARRTIALSPAAVAALRRWLKHVPSGEPGLLFPNGDGNVESYANLWHRLWCPLMRAAGLAEVETKGDGEEKREIVRPRFGLHQLRHVAVSLWIEQGATPKQVQHWVGHADITFTMNTYGHLWRDPKADQAIAAAAERSLLGKETV